MAMVIIKTKIEGEVEGILIIEEEEVVKAQMVNLLSLVLSTISNKVNPVQVVLDQIGLHAKSVESLVIWL